MKSVIAAVAACIALAAFRPFHSQSQVVAVHAMCDDGQLGEHSVTPEDVTIAQGEDVDWDLDDSSEATDLTVAPKQAAHWPYGNDEHFKGGRGHGQRAKGHGKNMKANAKGTYAYNIMLTCPDGKGGTTTVTIDPHIIIH